MTLDQLTDHIEQQNTRWTFATRRQRRRIVAMAIEVLPKSNTGMMFAESAWRERLPGSVTREVKKRYGRFALVANPFLILAIQIIVNLLIQWWLQRAEHAEVANAMREECRRVAG